MRLLSRVLFALAVFRLPGLFGGTGLSCAKDGRLQYARKSAFLVRRRGQRFPFPPAARCFSISEKLFRPLTSAVANFPISRNAGKREKKRSFKDSIKLGVISAPARTGLSAPRTELSRAGFSARVLRIEVPIRVMGPILGQTGRYIPNQNSDTILGQTGPKTKSKFRFSASSNLRLLIEVCAHRSAVHLFAQLVFAKTFRGVDWPPGNNIISAIAVRHTDP